MKWRKFFRLSGIVGAGICGTCLAKSKLQSTWPLGTVSASCDESTRPKNKSPSKPPQRLTKVKPAIAEEPASKTHEVRTTLDGLKLKQVQVFFRHGARLPLNITYGVDEAWYPWDIALRVVPHTVFNYQVVVLPERTPREEKDSAMEKHYKKTELLGGGYAGNLTYYGQQQMFELGVRLRDRYIRQTDLLPSYYDPEAVFVQSTDMNRTVESLRCVLAGMFGKDSLNENGPVVIPVSHPDDEILYPNSKVCALLKKANHAAMIHYDHIPGIYQDRLVVQKALGYRSTCGQDKEDKAGSSGHEEEKEPEPNVNFVALRDDLVCRKTHGYKLPQCLETHMEMINHNATKILYFAMTGQHRAERPVVTRLAAGPALNLAYETLKKSTGIGDPALVTPKISLYSAHDTTLVTLLETMGLFDWSWPPFGSDLCIELYSDREATEHFVRVLFNGQPQTVRGCSGTVCSFKEFEAAIQPYLIRRGREYDSMCASRILEEIASDLLEHDPGEIETEEIREKSEIPAGMD